MSTRGAYELACRVLVVDDVMDAAISLATMLEIYGAETRIALDGVEAVETAGAYRPEVVLMDVTMPRLDGYGAARRIRSEPWGGSVILLALTGWGQQRDVEMALAAGFDGHLLKPVEPDALLSLIGRLRAQRASRPA